MAHLPRLLVLPFLFLFLFLGIHVPASHGSPLPRTYDGSNATRETADYTSYSCGYTDLKVSCQGEGESKTPIIQLGNHNYTIKNIFYNNQTIMLVDADALRSTSCLKVTHNVTFDRELLNYTSSYDNLTFFYGCHFDTVPPDLDKDTNKIDCAGSDGPSGREFSFVFTSEELGMPQEYDLAGNCDQIFVAPVQRDFLMMTSNLPKLKRGGPGPGGYGDVLKNGFELTWNRNTTKPCYQVCNSSGASSVSASRYFNKRRKTYIIASTLSTFLLCLLLFAFFLGHKKYRSKKISKETPRIESFLQKNGTLHTKRYTYAEVKRMTNSFAVKLGQGGFGAVYRGNLSDGCQVAAKMLKDSKGDGEEFINEVDSIGRTSHVNVVTLLGFCLQGSKRVLIYEYMPNGSLERYAFNNSSEGGISLTWDKLFDIAVGIARGLEYLHRGCNTRIVHFDIKPHNILLDQDFCPKISDFGMAKLCINKESIISIGGARGTIGYIAPEVYSKQFGAVSSKSDVYSYGMMVLEMVGARDKNINANSESSSQYFPQWIYEHLDEYCVSASEINGEITEIVRKMIVIGLWCIQLNPTNRPTMTRVIEMLEGSTSGLELPPKRLLS